MKLKKTNNAKKEDLTELIDELTEDTPSEKKEEVKVVKKEAKEVKEVKKEDKKPLIEKVKENDMAKKLKKKFKFNLPVIIFIAVILLIGAVVLFLTLGNGGSKYGERLKGIDKISFTKKDKSKFVEAIKSNENVNSASIDIQGRIIYVLVDVKENVSVEDARNILNDSLVNLSDEVKGFYDINALVTKKDEVPVENVINDGVGNETIEYLKSFPISGYKRKTSDHIVW